MNVYYVAGIPYSNELYHFGIKGQKWGIRRYQNPDGSLTPAGKARYGTELEKTAYKDAQRYSDAKAAYGEGAGVRRKLLDKEINEKKKNKEYRKVFEEAQKHVDVNKSLNRAEKLHRKTGTFVRGRSLADRGYKHSQNAIKSIGSLAVIGLVTAAGYKHFKNSGDNFTANVLAITGGLNAVSVLGSSAKNAYSYEYYERNKKF